MTGFISTILGFAGSQVTASGQIAAGNAQAKADATQAQATDANANQQLVQGTQQRNIQISKAAADYVTTERQAGAIRAAYGAAGVDPNTGSPLLVASDQATQAELKRQTDLWQGLADQQAGATQAEMHVAEGQSYVQAGITAQKTGYTSAAATSLAGAAKAVGQIQGDTAQVAAMSW
jgi:hypothetical protein